MISRNAKHLRARALWVVGWTAKRIADELDCGEATVFRWKKKDLQENGIDWDDRREEYLSAGPDECLRVLRQQRLQLLESDEHGWEEKREALRKMDEVEVSIVERLVGLNTAVGALSKAREKAVEAGCGQEALNSFDAKIGRFLLDKYHSA